MLADGDDRRLNGEGRAGRTGGGPDRGGRPSGRLWLWLGLSKQRVLGGETESSCIFQSAFRSWRVRTSLLRGAATVCLSRHRHVGHVETASTCMSWKPLCASERNCSWLSSSLVSQSLASVDGPRDHRHARRPGPPPPLQPPSVGGGPRSSPRHRSGAPLRVASPDPRPGAGGVEQLRRGKPRRRIGRRTGARLRRIDGCSPPWRATRLVTDSCLPVSLANVASNFASHPASSMPFGFLAALGGLSRLRRRRLGPQRCTRDGSRTPWSVRPRFLAPPPACVCPLRSR